MVVSKPPALRAAPRDRSPEAWARKPVAHFGQKTFSGVEQTCKAANSTERGKQKPLKKIDAQTLAASRRRKRPEKGPANSSTQSTERIRKTRGAQSGAPRKKRQNKLRKDAQPKRATKQTRREQKQAKKNGTKNVQGCVMSCYYLSFLT